MRFGIEYDKEQFETFLNKETAMMLTLESFKSARSVLQAVLRPTPLIHSPYLSKNCRNNVYLKPENMQATGAYKLRGAYYKIGRASCRERV